MLAILWVYSTALTRAADRWSYDDRYSHGFLVPVFSLYLLWQRRQFFSAAPIQPSWCGLPMLLAGTAMHLAGVYYYFEWFPLASLLPCLAGICLLLGGWHALHGSWPAIAFLIFMIPLPYRAEVALAHPLQRLATTASTYILQTLGFSATAEGNVISLTSVNIGVVEACSGLSMLVVFMALSTAVAFLTHGPSWQKLVLVMSAVPIALIANVGRIVFTGVLHETAGNNAGDVFFHSFSGWLMMPLALVLLWIEVRILTHVFVEIEPVRPLPIDLT